MNPPTTGTGRSRWLCPSCGRLVDPYNRRCAWCPTCGALDITRTIRQENNHA